MSALSGLLSRVIPMQGCRPCPHPALQTHVAIASSGWPSLWLLTLGARAAPGPSAVPCVMRCAERWHALCKLSDSTCAAQHQERGRLEHSTGWRTCPLPLTSFAGTSLRHQFGALPPRPAIRCKWRCRRSALRPPRRHRRRRHLLRARGLTPTSFPGCHLWVPQPT